MQIKEGKTILRCKHCSRDIHLTVGIQLLIKDQIQGGTFYHFVLLTNASLANFKFQFVGNRGI